MPSFKDITGARYGRLVVVKLSNLRGPSQRIKWDCVCDCGGEISVTSNALIRGATKSCGCLLLETQRNNAKKGSAKAHLAAITHGLTIGGRPHPVLNSYNGMRGRCFNVNLNSYPAYGGRGITVCDEWLGKDGVANFIKDMMPTWQPGLSLGRIDNDGPYSPDNCRWETSFQQACNKRTTLIVSAFGKSQSAALWAKESGISYHVILTRLLRGWPHHVAVSRLPNRRYRSRD